MIRRWLDRFIGTMYTEEIPSEKIVVHAYWEKGYIGNIQKLGRAEGIVLFKKVYPYIEFQKIQCMEWKDGWCYEAVGPFLPGEIFYWSIRIRRRHYPDEARGFVGIASQGAKDEYQFCKKSTDNCFGVVENARKLVDSDKVKEPELKYELTKYAVLNGWMIAKNAPEENLLAIWCAKNGYLKVLDKEPSTHALTYYERDKLEEE